MAIAEPATDVPGVTRAMTYDEYLASPEEMARYDILDGWKVYRLYGGQQLPNPTRLHQLIQGNIYSAFRAYAKAQGTAQALMAPCDVLVIRESRLRMRQPDVLLISTERLAQNPPSTDPAPLAPAPELVVEILSPSDKPSALAAKIADYRAVDVREVWVVRLQMQTVDIVRLPPDETETAASHGAGETAASLAFAGLAAQVDDIFTL